MHERITLISHFDKASTTKIVERINKLGKNKNICKVPFGKNVDNRETADTLPFHFTMCAWNIADKENIISKLKQIKFSKLKIKIVGLNIMGGKENSYCLYFELEKNKELEKLQREIYNLCPSERYNPNNFTFHITIHIDKDYQKVMNMKEVLENNFKDMELVVENFGLYEIYPAKLVEIFLSKDNENLTISDKKYWNETYYGNLKESEKDFLKDIWLTKYKDTIRNVNNKNAIDLGCGLGQDSIWLFENGFNVISCDFSEKATNKFKEMYSNANIMNFDIIDGLPFKPNSVGLINANLSLHYFDMNKTIEIFDEIYKILETGGLFIGRVNSDKNGYVNDDYIEIEKDFYYDPVKEQHKRLFNREQFDILTKKWNVIILNEDETTRKGRKKYTWEFIFRK